MKRTLLIAILTAWSALAFAQTPELINYQAVARNANGELLKKQKVSVQLTILKTSAGGTAVYQEKHEPETNEYGLINLKIGGGTPISGTFSSISWATDKHFLKVELDPAGGANYTNMGTSQLVSVPYALASKTADTAKNMPNINPNAKNSTVEVTSESGYAKLGIYPTESSVSDSSTLFLGEGSSKNIGMGITYNGKSDELKVFGQVGSTPIEPPHITVERNSGETKFSKGIEVVETTSTPEPKKVYGNSMPIAYGYIQNTLVSNDYGITSVTKTGTGVYEVKLDIGFSAPVVSVTPFNNSGDAEIPSYEYSSITKTITVRFVDENNTAVNTNFSIIVFSLPK